MAVKKITGDSYGLTVDYSELNVKKAVIEYMRGPNLDTFTKLVCSGVTDEHLRGYRVKLDWSISDDINETINSVRDEGGSYVNYRDMEIQYFKYFSSGLSLAPWIVHYLSGEIFNILNSRVRQYAHYRLYLTDDLLDELIIRRLRSYYYRANNEYAEVSTHNELYQDLKHIDSHTYKHNGINSFDRGMYNAKFTTVLSEAMINNYDGSYRFSRYMPLGDYCYEMTDRLNALIKQLLVNSKHDVVKDIGNLVLNHMNWVDVIKQSEVIYKGPTEPCRDEYSVFSSPRINPFDFYHFKTRYYDEFLDY